MSKKYCSKCEHHGATLFNYGNCRIAPYYRDNWYKKNMVYVSCDKRNKNNDCKHFEKKKPEIEKLQSTSPPPKIKKGFRYYLSKL